MDKPKSMTLGLFLGALLMLMGMATMVPVLPKAEAASSTISTSTTVDDFTVNQGDTAIINSGVTLDAITLTNHGTIINHGTIYTHKNFTNTDFVENNGTLIIEGPAYNDGGTIDSFGYIEWQGQADPGFLNSHGGKINIKQGGSLVFSRGGSYFPHSLINDKDSVIDNFGSATEAGYGGMSVANSGTIYNECNATFSIPVSGNAVIDKCVASPTDTLTVKSQDTNGNTISGYWTVLYDGNGNVLKTGFTPVTFTLDAGQQYKIGMGNYGSYSFDHWLNDGSTNPRNISVNSNTQLTAVYKNAFPIIHMQDKTESYGVLMGPNNSHYVSAEWVKPSSVLVGKKIDSITLKLQRVGFSTGVAEIAVFDVNKNVKKSFGSILAGVGAGSTYHSDLPTTMTEFEFKLPPSDPGYTIQADDRIGILWGGGSGNSGSISVMMDKVTSGSLFDGTNTQRIRGTLTGWYSFDTGEDLWMVLKQTHA